MGTYYAIKLDGQDKFWDCGDGEWKEITSLSLYFPDESDEVIARHLQEAASDGWNVSLVRVDVTFEVQDVGD